jgi:hypothetical protein
VERCILGAWRKVALLGLIAWKQSHVSMSLNIEAGAFHRQRDEADRFGGIESFSDAVAPVEL